VKKKSGSVKPWPLVSSTAQGDFKVFSVRKDVARSPRTGLAHDFYVLDGPNWTNVVALTGRKEMVFVRQFRHGTRTVTLEIPGGCIDPGDRSPLAAARRELLEETGYAAPRWRRIGVVDPNPAILSNACTTYLALGARRVADQRPDGTEELDVVTVPLAEVPALVRGGAIRHALVLAAFHWLTLSGEV
jgi:ADP-ribose pyrophosphatase